MRDLLKEKMEKGIGHLYNTTKMALERGAEFKKIIEKYESLGLVDVKIECDGKRTILLNFTYVGERVYQTHVFEFVMESGEECVRERVCCFFSVEHLTCSVSSCLERARDYPHHELISL